MSCVGRVQRWVLHGTAIAEPGGLVEPSMPSSATSPPEAPSNARIAAALEEVAMLLDTQGADVFRVRAWRTGADAVRTHPRPLTDVLAEHGQAGIDAIEHIGPSLAAAITELLRTGHLATLDRLRGEVPAERLLASVPGIGATLARRIHAELKIDTLEDLEAAAWDGRLQGLRGLGARRVRAIRDLLEARLARGAGRVPAGRARDAVQPAVNLLLEIDRMYRTRARAGDLRMIAPRRFNPTRTAWLPILHLDRDGWAFTALYSNTARAHELGRTRDWVVIYWDRDGGQGQCTVTTETRGPLAGKRVVRGREAECAGTTLPGDAISLTRASTTTVATPTFLPQPDLRFGTQPLTPN